MKYLLIILLLTNNNVRAQQTNYKELFNSNSIATYFLCFAGGLSDGLNDCVVANKFHDDPFWGLDAWKNKGHASHFRATYLTMSCDGFHLTKFVTPIFYCAAIGITFGEKRNWKYDAAKTAISFLSSRIGHELAYEVIFKNYPH